MQQAFMLLRQHSAYANATGISVYDKWPCSISIKEAQMGGFIRGIDQNIVQVHDHALI
ncbi:hypothetical protein DUNSADRAFT_15543 [Dunaliella salina]|uniref:Uncharacterized protein n=1 Tax=Dunaliella salina TaxID=3046 RepID=A0ABQ7G575_DUNSA|nr:hypothetical protein DUNSADRAFT_15543 [Dunaliella salina]|eukprot:KAF5829761.1 hypothetical protein DUNSADRAFT_15543 [Dunaliella salina]